MKNNSAFPVTALIFILSCFLILMVFRGLNPESIKNIFRDDSDSLIVGNIIDTTKEKAKMYLPIDTITLDKGQKILDSYFIRDAIMWGIIPYKDSTLKVVPTWLRIKMFEEGRIKTYNMDGTISYDRPKANFVKVEMKVKI